MSGDRFTIEHASDDAADRAIAGLILLEFCGDSQ
jgi:hypothetical protein